MGGGKNGPETAGSGADGPVYLSEWREVEPCD